MEEQQNQVNGKSIASMVLGIASIVIPYVGIVLGIIGIVFAKKALDEIKMHNQDGRGMAITGLVTSIVGVSLYCFIILILIIIGSVASSL